MHGPSPESFVWPLDMHCHFFLSRIRFIFGAVVSPSCSLPLDKVFREQLAFVHVPFYCLMTLTLVSIQSWAA